MNESGPADELLPRSPGWIKPIYTTNGVSGCIRLTTDRVVVTSSESRSSDAIFIDVLRVINRSRPERMPAF
jgi:hypothetical protein